MLTGSLKPASSPASSNPAISLSSKSLAGGSFQAQPWSAGKLLLKLTQTPQPPQDLHNPVHPRQVPGKPRGLPPARPHLANVMGTHSHVCRTRNLHCTSIYVYNNLCMQTGLLQALHPCHQALQDPNLWVPDPSMQKFYHHHMHDAGQVMCH